MSTDRPTLLDVAKQLDPNGQPAQVIEVIDDLNPMIQDAPAIASNAPDGNKVTRRSTLPGVSWRKINEGVVRRKGTTHQVKDTIGMLTGLSEIDAQLLPTQGGAVFNAMRFNEDKAYMESSSQEVETTILYGNEQTEESAFTGFAPRLDALATSIYGSQVRQHHAGSGADRTSLYIVDWHPDMCALMYPMHSQAGWQVNDLGRDRVLDPNGKPFMAFVTEYNWHIGVTVKDPRHIARLCNIDVSTALADTTVKLTDSLIHIMNAMPAKAGANRVIYCSRDMLSALELQMQAQMNVLFSWDEYLGEKHLHFKGSPFRASDQVSSAESEIS